MTTNTDHHRSQELSPGNTTDLNTVVSHNITGNKKTINILCIAVLLQHTRLLITGLVKETGKLF